MTEQTTFQTVVIGAGSAGLTVAIGLAALGRNVALIEGRAVGGDCTNVGCIPSKTLIHLVRDQHYDGDSAVVLREVQQKRNSLRDRETDDVQHHDHLTFFHGRARLLGPRQLSVQLDGGDTRTLSAESIVIATGSHARTIDIPGLPDDRLLTNEHLFELEEAPHHLAIIGSGVIAMEMAFAFRRLGSKVSVVTRGGTVHSSSPAAASDVLHGELRDRDIAVYYHARPQRYNADSDTLVVRTANRDAELMGVDAVLLAVGRERNTDDLGLEAAGVAYDDHGIAIDAFGQTNVPGIYAIGDVTPTSRYTHSANAQGRRVVQRIAFPFLPAFGKEPLYPAATFSEPEVASVGQTPKEIAARYHPALIHRLEVQLSDLDRGYTDGLKRGFIQVYAMRLTGRILGVTIVGPMASEMVSFFTLAISRRISLYRLYRLVYPYPTYSGGILKIADSFMRETLPNIPRELGTYLRYRFATPPKDSGTHRQEPA